MDFKQIKGVNIKKDHIFLKSREDYLTGKDVLRTDENHFWTVLEPDRWEEENNRYNKMQYAKHMQQKALIKTSEEV